MENLWDLGCMRQEGEDTIQRTYSGICPHCIALVEVKVFVLVSVTSVVYLSGTVLIVNPLGEFK